MQLPDYPKRIPGLYSEELEGLDEVIYVRPEDGASFSLNLTAATVLDLCDGEHQCQAIARLLHEALPAEQAPDLGSIRSDVDRIIESFVEQGLVQATTATDNE